MPGHSDVEIILAQQLRTMQVVMAETERACAVAGQHHQLLAELQSENVRLRTKLSNAGIECNEADEAGALPAWALPDGLDQENNLAQNVPGSVPGTHGSSHTDKMLMSDAAAPSLRLAPILPVQTDGSRGKVHQKPSDAPQHKHSDVNGVHKAKTTSGTHEAVEDDSAPKAKAAVFADASALKEKLRQNMAKPAYDVRDFYWETGCAQKVARSHWFEHITLAVIAFNALWIWIDTDYNHAEILLDAHPVFIAMENFFCVYFFMEWLFRWLSFKRKRDTVKDAWFCFDSALVFMMVGETWIMTLFVWIIGGGNSSALGNASILRLFRLLRLSRMARMARLLKAMPELLVLIKGMVVAMRSVFFTLCLLGGILYIFGIAFVQLMKDTPAGDLYFPKVPQAMDSLLLRGILPDESEMIDTVGEDGWVFKIIVLFYILLASLTVMNMLVGVLCEVVSVVSAVEKESLLVTYVKATLQHMLQTSGIDADGDQRIARHEFEALLELPGAAKAIQEVGVDVVGLMDFTDFIFKDGKELSFPDFMDILLQLRGSNTATVKDVIDLRKALFVELGRFNQKIDEVAGGHFMQNPAYAPGMQSQAYPMQVPSQISSVTGVTSVTGMTPTNANGISWAASAANRLNAAASELSAAAGELSLRQKKKRSGEQGQYLMVEDVTTDESLTKPEGQTKP